MKISALEASLLRQSANLDAKPKLSKGDFLLVASLAFLAAILAREACNAFSITILASLGFSKKYLSNPSPKFDLLFFLLQYFLI